ncbi:hypothetical protein [Viridibacillus arvi]|uniref:hypothetical protein n=1 Tax=Viridibacillus arvi TaxID=263475 RepID=UPI0034CDB202
MKDIINLQSLKRSKNKKHRTIHGKAHRIMISGYKTPKLKEEEILEIAKDFPTLTVNILMGGDIIIRSIKDSWLIRDETRFYTLYHKGTFYDCGRIKERYHVQDVFRDLNYIFASVVSHDEYAIGIKERKFYEINELIP